MTNGFRHIASAMTVALAACPALTSAQTPPPLSPGWSPALPAGPDARVKITEEYARHVARDAYFWAWPLVNVYNRRLGYTPVQHGR